MTEANQETETYGSDISELQRAAKEVTTQREAGVMPLAEAEPVSVPPTPEPAKVSGSEFKVDEEHAPYLQFGSMGKPGVVSAGVSTV